MTTNTKDVPKLALKQVGDKVTMCVEQARKLPFGQYPEAEFYGMIGSGELVAVVMPLKAAEKQLGNLNIGRMDEQGHFPDAVGKYLTIKRSDNKAQPSRPFWDIYLARAGEFETEDFAESLRNDPNGHAEDGAAPTPVPAPASAPATPAGERELSVADQKEQKARAGMNEMRRKYHALWESEMEFQVLAALRVRRKIAQDLQVPMMDVPAVVIDGSSVNAATAAQWINFDRRNWV